MIHSRSDIEAARARNDDDRTTGDWNLIEAAARRSLATPARSDIEAMAERLRETRLKVIGGFGTVDIVNGLEEIETSLRSIASAPGHGTPTRSELADAIASWCCGPSDPEAQRQKAVLAADSVLQLLARASAPGHGEVEIRWVALAAAPPPPAGDADAGARLIAEWLGYAWDGLREGSSVERGSPVWIHNRYGGYSLQGGQEDLRILARRIAALSAGEAVAEAVAAERERCAAVADDISAEQTDCDLDTVILRDFAADIAAAIRARSEGQHG